MSDVKFARNLFLEVEELNRLKVALKDTGFSRDFMSDHESVGIVKNQYYDPFFSYFQVLNIDVANTVFISPGFAYDKNRNVLTSQGTSILIPQQNTYYWVKIAYKTNNTEKGTVSIGGSAGGLMTGLGTEFTKILRGQPNFPSKIKFLNSVNYQSEYEVLEVDADGTAYLQGAFPVAEVNLQYAIVGTFTPGAYPPQTDKFPFLYDDFTFSLIPEGATDVAPAFQEGTEFYLARIISFGTTVQIQDKRDLFVSQTRAERLFSELPAKANPLIGIESMVKTVIRNKVSYTVSINWGFRVVTESRNYNANVVTVTGGNGGTYASSSAFTTGDFDNWRYYYQDGNYSRIISSTKNGSGFDLQLDSLRSESPGAMVCPNAEEIEVMLSFFIATSTGTGQQYKVELKKFYIFTLNPEIIINYDDLDSNFLEVDLQYRYKTVLTLTNAQQFNLSTYNVPDLANVTSKNLLFNSSSGGGTPPATAWRGINPFCVLDTLAGPLYYQITTGNTTVIPTVYSPNSSFPSQSVDRTTVDLTVHFYTDAGLTTPASVTHTNLRIVVKESDAIQTTAYNVGGQGNTVVSNLVTERLLVYFISPAAVNNMFLATVDQSEKSYIHPTNQVGVREITGDLEATFSGFPGAQVIVANTGDKGFQNLEQYDTTTGLPTGSTKSNVNTDPDYIAPTQDLLTCSTTPDSLELDYGYGLNVQEAIFTGTTTGVKNGPVISNTTSGGYTYLLSQYVLNETVTLKVKVSTLDPGNQSGLVWVRVTWKAVGSNSVTYTNIQVANNVETQLAQVFTNIVQVFINNY